MKSLHKKIKLMKDKESLRQMAEFLLTCIQETWVLPIVPNCNAKLLEFGLKLLYKAWKQLLNHKYDHAQDFRQKLVQTINQVQANYPQNDIFKAVIIKLQVLASRFYTQD